MASLESFGKEAFRINAKEPFSRIQKAVSRTPASGKPFTLTGEILKEGALLPLRNISAIMSFTGRSMMKVLGHSIGLGLQAATLIPLPLPGGTTSIAELKAKTNDVKVAMKEKALGAEASLQSISDRLRDERIQSHDTQGKSEAS